MSSSLSVATRRLHVLPRTTGTRAGFRMTTTTRTTAPSSSVGIGIGGVGVGGGGGDKNNNDTARRHMSSVPMDFDHPDYVNFDDLNVPSFREPMTQTASRRRSSPLSSSQSQSSQSQSSLSSTPRVEYAPIYVSATRQHVGKTTTSMALLSGLQKRFDHVGFMKPVGQQSLTVRQDDDGDDDDDDEHITTTIQVDKDAVLVKEHFGLDHLQYQDISPYLIPRGYTRDYLDGKIHRDDQAETLVKQAYQNVSSNSEIVLCEGTGHCAVGSIVHASNAKVASWLNAKMVLVANGGLGNTFDELELNKVLCDKEHVEICGVIVNKVQPDKMEQTREYISKALQVHWGNDVPLLGCIPDRPFLGCPALSDHEKLFDAKLITGQQHRLRHYTVKNLNLVATSLQVFLRDLRTNDPRTLYVCHSSRDDIILGFLMESPLIISHGGVAPRHPPSESALIVTGLDEHPLSDQVMDIIYAMRDSPTAPPILLTSDPTNVALEKMTHHTPKLNYEDSHRASVAVNHYEPYIDFDLLLERSGHLAASNAADRRQLSTA